MIVKTPFKGINVKCDCCSNCFSDVTMIKYEIGAFKTFCLCKDCEENLTNVLNANTNKKVLGISKNSYYLIN